MTSFGVEAATLADMGHDLRGLKKEFDGMEDLIEDNYTDAVGDDGLAGRLVEFADNWSHKRDDVGDLLEKVAGFAEEAAKAYSKKEQELCAALQGKG